MLSNILLSAAAAAKSLQSCPTLRDPIDSSPPGSPNPGILQARTLEWVTISFSSGGATKSSGALVLVAVEEGREEPILGSGAAKPQ